MIYRGYTIVLERQECEIWSLDENGEPEEYLNECEDSMHQGGTYVYQVRTKFGGTVAATTSVGEAKTTINEMVALDAISSEAKQ